MKKEEIKTELLTEENILRKSFNRNVLFYYKGQILKRFPLFTDNMEYTLEAIDEERVHLKKIKELLIPESIGTIDGANIGILCKQGYANNLGVFIKNYYSFDLRIEVLKKLGKLLEHLNNLRTKEHILTDFFIGDLHEENVLFDFITGNIQICDLDACKIHDNEVFLIKYYSTIFALKKYYKKDKSFIVSQESDLYCYIVIIMRILFSFDITCYSLKEYQNIVLQMKKNSLPTPLVDIFLNLYRNTPNENPYRYLDYIPEKLEKKIHL